MSLQNEEKCEIKLGSENRKKNVKQKEVTNKSTLLDSQTKMVESKNHLPLKQIQPNISPKYLINGRVSRYGIQKNIRHNNNIESENSSSSASKSLDFGKNLFADNQWLSTNLQNSSKIITKLNQTRSPLSTIFNSKIYPEFTTHSSTKIEHDIIISNDKKKSISIITIVDPNDNKPNIENIELQQFTINQSQNQASLLQKGQIPELEPKIDTNVNESPLYEQYSKRQDSRRVTRFSVISDRAKGSSVDTDLIDMGWKIGQLVWAHIESFPYWPCIICPDENDVFLMRNKQSILIYVRFFADNERSFWVNQSSIFPFYGIKSFAEKRNALPKNLKPRDPKLKAFFVSQGEQTNWHQAIVEAETMSNFSLKIRVEMLKSKSISSNYLIASNDFSIDSRFTETDSKNTYCFTEVTDYVASSQYGSSSSTRSSLYEEHTPLRNKRYRQDNFSCSSPSLSSSSSSSHSCLIKLENKIQKYSDSMINATDNFILEPVSNELLNANDVLSMENDQEFNQFYLTTKGKILGECDEATEFMLKKLAMEMWLLKQNKEAEMPKAKIRKIHSAALSQSSTSSVTNRIENSSMKHKNYSQDLSLEKKTLQMARLAEKEQKVQKEMSKYFMKEYPKNHLFKGLKRAMACNICCTINVSVLKCSKLSCNEYIHQWCSEHPNGKFTDENLGALEAQAINTTSKPVFCLNCQLNNLPVCFVCKTSAILPKAPIKCNEKTCGRYYHVACLKYWPQYKIIYTSESNQSLLCPCHICHTCISDDPRNKHFNIDNKKLTKCVKCSATYHIDSCCIPAGSILLSIQQLICPRHRIDIRKPINADWCFLCGVGGQLICCETCPTAFHLACLKIQPPDKYICEECETGRMPLYGEIVWAKLGSCRWWPSVILPATAVPARIQSVKHKKHDLCVRFFGTNDFAWLSRSFVFLYQEDDSDFCKTENLNIDKSYEIALTKAKEWFKQIKAIEAKHVSTEKDRQLKPLPYIKIKVNYPVPPVKLNDVKDEESLQICQCSVSDPAPCGSGSGCLNRMLMYECNAKFCKAREKCQNQRFEQRRYPNLEERRMVGKGWGLFTLEPISSGQFIIEYIGEIINEKEFQRRYQQKEELKDEHYYFLTLNRNLTIDSGLKGNVSRFMNHSCKPNCETQLWQVIGHSRVGLFALHDIPAGTELTFNYQFQYNTTAKKTCLCGAEKCAGFIGAKYIEKDNQENKHKKTNNKCQDTVVPLVKQKKEKKKKLLAKPNDNSLTVVENNAILTLEKYQLEGIINHVIGDDNSNVVNNIRKKRKIQIESDDNNNNNNNEKTKKN